MRWPPDRQKLLADLSALGFSAGDIARLTGETRAAVANAMWRNGLFARAKRQFTPRDEPVPQMRG
jgi:hypothetical protein